MKNNNRNKLEKTIPIMVVLMLISIIVFFLIWSIFENNDGAGRTSLEWFIWLFFVIGFSMILIFSTIYYSWVYRKENRKVLTLKKIPVLALYFSIFLIQSFITRLSPEFGELIPFSLDNVTVIVVGVIFGPIEGMLFGFIADFSRTLINGWTYQLLASIIFPITVLIAGVFGRIYFNASNNITNIDMLNEQEIIYPKDKGKSIMENKAVNIIIFNLILLIFVLSSVFAIYITQNNGNTSLSILFIMISSPILIAMMEITYLYILFKKPEDLSLFLTIFIIVVFSRIITGYVIRPYSLYFYYGIPIKTSIIQRVVTSSYLIPSTTIVTFFVVKASMNSIKLIYN